ncbi:MAG: CapA family protein [Gemmatimonadetes bacterium]|nr:CapA family protein [Gemmatimonadota bacterium]
MTLEKVRTILVSVPLMVALWPALPASLRQTHLSASGQSAPEVPATGPDSTLSVAAVGDALIRSRIAQYDDPGDPGFQRMVKVIRDADVAFVNLEGSVLRFSEFKGWPAAEHGGYWQVSPPEVAEDLKAIGFDLFNTANNHTADWGVEGVRMTHETLDRLGLIHAGSGMNLGEASRPGYLDTLEGRVALIGLATTFSPSSRAGAARGEVMGRPGLNALRVDRTYEADAATYDMLGALAPKVGGQLPTASGAPLRIFGVSVRPGRETRLIERVNARDEERILREIRNASRMANYVIVNSHSHEPGNQFETPPPWLVEFMKKCIDAGATTYIVHGPHRLRGIELYKGRPLFYSVGNFIYHEELWDVLPADQYDVFDLPDTSLPSDFHNARFQGGTVGAPANPVYYQSVIAVPVFRGSSMIELKLYPVDLGQHAARPQRGTPRLADEAMGRKIIDEMARLSARYGTSIVYEGGIGVWRASTKTSSQEE